MPELRWTLLILGVLFIGGLAWWERRKPRHAPGAPAGGESHGARAAREPGLTLPEIRVRDPAPPRQLPVVEIRDEQSSAESLLRLVPVLEPAEPLAGEASDPGAPAHEGPAVAPAVAAEPIVEWPPDEARRIIALRLVAPAPERFAGHAVRQALWAEGFVLGKFSIFHKPDEERRAVVSAACLTMPGTFDLETMDSQRYGGLSLFAVLPGPKTAPQAFDDLLATARTLNERLQGVLQDEQGGPLTPARIASLRDSLTAETD